MLAEVALPIKLTFRLWLRFWPQLVAVVLLGLTVSHILMYLAVKTAYGINHYGGLAVLTLVALTQLVTTVSMIHIVRPGLPSVSAAQAPSGGQSVSGGSGLSRLTSIIAIALIPFFAYYAAWGFLGDVVRQYSRLALSMAPFGGGGFVLDVLDSKWILLSVVLSWLVRWFAKTMQQRTKRAFWEIVIVVCETNWVFIGLYVISRWKDDWMQALVNGRLWAWFDQLLAALAQPVSVAYAAAMVPVEQIPEGFGAVAVNLFFYTLWPVVWLVMVALVYGYDVRDQKELMAVHHRVERFGERYRAVPKFFRDFINHFISGYRSRYLPVANGVRLTMNSGLLLLITLIIGYRFIEWAAAWAWLGAAQIIGPQTGRVWEFVGNAVVFLFGSPLQDSSTGVLVEPLRICFLAAVLETAFSMRRKEPASPISDPADEKAIPAS
jgi:hypothetical protein